MSLDPVDQSSSAIGQPKVTSVAGLHLMSTRMKSRTLFLHLRKNGMRCLRCFSSPCLRTCAHRLGKSHCRARRTTLTLKTVLSQEVWHATDDPRATGR